MKIEIGKFYKNRSGKKVLALALNPFVGDDSEYRVVTATDEELGTSSVSLRGELVSKEVYDEDLVEEWVEPEDAPLDISDIESGIAFKPKSREDEVKYYPQVASHGKVTFLEFNYSYHELKNDWLMQLPGTTKWVPCSKKSIATARDSH